MPRAGTGRAGQPPPKRWRCMVPECPAYGRWQTIIEGEEYIADDTDPRSHYWRTHYVETERIYQEKLAAQKQRRLEHYRLTGEFLPPEV